MYSVRTSLLLCQVHLKQYAKQASIDCMAKKQVRERKEDSAIRDMSSKAQEKALESEVDSAVRRECDRSSKVFILQPYSQILSMSQHWSLSLHACMLSLGHTAFTRTSIPITFSRCYEQENGHPRHCHSLLNFQFFMLADTAHRAQIFLSHSARHLLFYLRLLIINPWEYVVVTALATC